MSRKEGLYQKKMAMKTQQEHLLSKYVGTGDADAPRHEVAVNMHRDTYAYIVRSVALFFSSFLFEGGKRFVLVVLCVVCYYYAKMSSYTY